MSIDNKGFNSDQYLAEQSQYIRERVNKYERLYLEFGGKLAGDFHAMRVLPGFDPDAKIRLLHELREQTEIIIAIYADDINQNKIRGDYGISYENEVMRMIDEFRHWDLRVNSVVVTRYNGEASAAIFRDKLQMRGIKVYMHAFTEGYPNDIETIVSDDGYGMNPYIEVTQPLVVVSAPGANSGKLATCLSQIYHEQQRGRKAGYAKFETFPIWNLPLKHPVNLAYEAATAELGDVNMIDPYHLEAYGQSAVNYNRDIDAFPLLHRILQRIMGDGVYNSPTDMGVNRAGFCISDDSIVQKAATQEIIRRYFHLACDYRKGICTEDTYQRVRHLMDILLVTDLDRPVVQPAREYAGRLQMKVTQEREDGANKDVIDAGSSAKRRGIDPFTVIALQDRDGNVVTGRASERMSAVAACLLNIIKLRAGIADPIHLLSPVILRPISELKTRILGLTSQSLDAKEILIALSMSAATNPSAYSAMQELSSLRGSQAHSTTIVSKIDEDVCRELGIDLTCDPEFASARLFSENA